MKVDYFVEKQLSVCSAQYAQVRKEICILVNESNEVCSANIERVRELQKLEKELEFSLTYLAMSIAGYGFGEVDGICQYVKI